MSDRVTNRELGRRQFIAGVTGGLVISGALPDVASAATPGPPPPSPAGPIQISLTSTRTQLTIAEPVELALAYAGSAESVALEARHEDGSVIALVVPLAPGDRTRGRVITFPPGMLKPGAYAVVARDAGSGAPPVTFAVHRDEHASAYFVGAWMHRTADAPTVAAKGGWMYFSSDLVLARVRKPEQGDIMERYVAARMRPYSLCVMGGGHQLDMDLANDWGDPWVQRSVTWKMGLSALSNRLYPCAGLSAFDEPGLTWWPSYGPDGKRTGTNPFSTPVHLQEFRTLAGKQMPAGTIDESLAQGKAGTDAWIDFVSMRLRYLEQAWWAAVRAVDQAHAPFTTINQLASSYSPGNVTDGVDNRMNRPFRVLSGHGGYSDFLGAWGPVTSARAYDGWSWDRPHYFLPMWGGWDYARMRQEVWLPWSVKLEGIEYDPNHDWSLAGSFVDATSILEIAEVNRRLALVGDVMTRMPRSLAPVAVLTSHTQYAYDLVAARDPKAQVTWKFAYLDKHRRAVLHTMWRAMSAGLAPNWIDEYEVVEKGAAFLRQWKVVYCPGLAVIRPEFRNALEQYVAAGGTLVQGKGDAAEITGSVRVSYAYPDGEPPDEGMLRNDYASRRRSLELAPGFDTDLKSWLSPQAYSSNAPLDAMLLTVQRAGFATYLLMANSSQDPENARHIQMDPVPLETTINLPGWGTLYDLLNGGAIVVAQGKAPLRLAAGDGACWLHLPSPPGPLKLTVEAAPWALDVSVAWGTDGYLPFRLRVYDPAGNLVEELIRATTPDGSVQLATTFRHRIALGANAAPGKWTVEAHEWLTGSTTLARAEVRADPTGAAVTVGAGGVSVYFEDAPKIRELFAGRAKEPPFDRMNEDCRRVFRLDAKRFAVFGPDDAAERIAAALRAKGMTAVVNPPTEIVPFVREPGHGGTGPIVDAGKSNFENVYAHTIVLPGHALGQRSWERGQINRPVTATFPGAGRAYVQWGVGGYQAGFENVWVFGDVAVGVSWVLAAIEGRELAGESATVGASVRPATSAPARMPKRFVVAQEIKLWDTPAGIGMGPDGKVIYVLLAGGMVAAYDGAGREVWSRRPLLQGGCLAVSPRGDRLAVGGFPGLFVLDAANGRVLGGYRVDPPARDQSLGQSRMITAAWNDEGTIVAGGGYSDGSTSTKGGAVPVLPLAILDAQGGALPRPQGISGHVMGTAFVPRTSTLIVGAAKLTAVNATTGSVLWKGDLEGAQSIRFHPDGGTGAAGGWGKRAGVFATSDGKVSFAAGFDSNVGGVALLPGGDLAVAVWGGTHPLYRLRADPKSKPAAMAQARFAFHDVLWLEEESGVVAAEQGGTLWLLDANGKARAKLEDAGTTAHRVVARGRELLVGRMNRVVQRVKLA